MANNKVGISDTGFVVFADSPATVEFFGHGNTPSDRKTVAFCETRDHAFRVVKDMKKTFPGVSIFVARISAKYLVKVEDAGVVKITEAGEIIPD